MPSTPPPIISKKSISDFGVDECTVWMRNNGCKYESLVRGSLGRKEGEGGGGGMGVDWYQTIVGRGLYRRVLTIKPAFIAMKNQSVNTCIK